MFNKTKYLIFMILLLVVACSKKDNNDVDYKTIGYIDNNYPIWYVYENFLNVNDLDTNNMLYSYNDGSFVDFDYIADSVNKNKKIHIKWDGNVAKLYGTNTEVSVYSLILKFKTPKDLSYYNRFKFDITGSVASDVKLIVKVNDVVQTPVVMGTTNTFNVASLTNVSSICSFTLESNNTPDVNLKSGSSDIYIDNIRFERG